MVVPRARGTAAAPSPLSCPFPHPSPAPQRLLGCAGDASGRPRKPPTRTVAGRVRRRLRGSDQGRQRERRVAVGPSCGPRSSPGPRSSSGPAPAPAPAPPPPPPAKQPATRTSAAIRPAAAPPATATAAARQAAAVHSGWSECDGHRVRSSRLPRRCLHLRRARCASCLARSRHAANAFSLSRLPSPSCRYRGPPADLRLRVRAENLPRLPRLPEVGHGRGACARTRAPAAAILVQRPAACRAVRGS